MVETIFETTQTGKNNTHCVYCHRNKINGKRYIGQTKFQDNLTNRWGSDGRGYKSNKYFQRAIEKYGWDAFDHYVIQKNLTEEQADELEKLNIAFYNTTDPKYGYNIDKGGKCGGHPASDYQKEVASKTFKGKPSWNKGIPLSDEHRAKVSASLKGVNTWSKGRILSEEHISRIKEANTGRIVSQETREKLSKLSKGRKMSDEAKQKIREVNKDRRYMHKDGRNTTVKPEDIDKYLSDGWVLGRITKKRKKE